MISLRKLQSLPKATRIRKAVRLLDGFVEYGALPDARYLEGFLSLIVATLGELGFDEIEIGHGRNTQDRAAELQGLIARTRSTDVEEGIRAADRLRYHLRSLLEIPVADWDLVEPAGFGGTRSGGKSATEAGAGDSPDRETARYPISVYLESIRSPFNAGSIVRTAAALGVSRVGMSPDCPPVDHPRFVRSARGAEALVTIERSLLWDLEQSWRPFVALETGGEPVTSIDFPPSGTLVVGSEELGLSPDALSLAGARVSIRMSGRKGSVNVGVACGIALHAWIEKL